MHCFVELLYLVKVECVLLYRFKQKIDFLQTSFYEIVDFVYLRYSLFLYIFLSISIIYIKLKQYTQTAKVELGVF